MTSETIATDQDAIIVGAGLGGLRTMIELRKLGISFRCFEAGDGIGGTWFWNRYPGARTDSESWTYCYQFDRELFEEWDWHDRFPGQVEVENYLNFVADRFDLRKDIQLGATVKGATFDEDSSTWTVTLEDGTTSTSRYFIVAGGPLAARYTPDLKGIDDFGGTWVHTSRWPEGGIDVRGKRVGIVGTGATGVQLIPELAKEAANVTVFQRTPNYVIPARNHPLSDTDRRSLKADADRISNVVREHWFGMDLGMAGRLTTDVTPEEQQKILEWGWEIGGFHFIFETFDDIFLTHEANEVVAEFVRNKIRQIVKDPETAEKLAPKGYPIASKRVPLGHYYYEAYNRPNVDLVDVSENALAEATSSGITLADGTHYDVDILVFATGFDASTGSITRMDIRGRDGLTIQESWAEGAQTHLGVATKGFPNLFMVFGPQTPFANFPPVAENIVEFLSQALTHLEESGAATMEATQEAMDEWAEHLDVLLNALVLSEGERVRSWFVGANIPGKPHKVLFHFGGVAAYCASTQAVIDEGWKGFVFEGSSAKKDAV